MHSLVIIASCLMISFGALSMADEGREKRLESAQVVDKLKKNAAEALERLKATLKQAEDQADDIVDKSIFRHHADIIHQNVLEAINGNFSLVQEAIAVLKSQNETSEVGLKCLESQHNSVAKKIQAAVDQVNQTVATSIGLLKRNVRQISENYHAAKLLGRIEKINANIGDVDSYLDAIKIIIDNLDLPIKIVKSIVKHVAEKELELTIRLEKNINMDIHKYILVATDFLVLVQKCVDERSAAWAAYFT